MSSRAEISATLARLQKLAPKGYYIGLHIRFAAPIMQFQTYPAAWIENYASNGYALRDPTIAWGFSTTGAIRWSMLVAVWKLRFPSSRSFVTKNGLAMRSF